MNHVRTHRHRPAGEAALARGPGSARGPGRRAAAALDLQPGRTGDAAAPSRAGRAAGGRHDGGKRAARADPLAPLRSRARSVRAADAAGDPGEGEHDRRRGREQRERPSGSSGSKRSTTSGTRLGHPSGQQRPRDDANPACAPAPPPKPAPTGLTSTQSYRVTIGITNSAGDLDSIDPAQRLSILPSARQPLLVELGVLKGGRRVLFVVQPGTVVKGPGTCTPGPIDCEILSLAEGQTEGISATSPSGLVPVALFAVTAITAQQHASTAAADRARRAVAAAGRRLLSTSKLGALSLFQYQPSLGAVLDLRNLTVGGG